MKKMYILFLVALATVCNVWAADTGKDLIEAINMNDTQRVQDLLAKDVDLINSKIDENGHTPLHLAAYRGHTAMVQLLLKYGADVNARNQLGYIPLYYAASEGHPAIVELLLKDRGVEVNNEDPRTPLTAAIEQGSTDIVRRLLDYGFDVNSKGMYGRTPLHWAANYVWRIPIVQLLLQRGADINSTSNRDSTPLHDAVAIGGQKEVVKVLLEHGADKALKDDEGKTAADLARGKRYDEKRYADLAKFIDEYVPDTGLTKGAVDR